MLIIITVIITLWIALGIHYNLEDAFTPFGNNDLWLITFALAPIFYIIDRIDDYKTWKKIMKQYKRK